MLSIFKYLVKGINVADMINECTISYQAAALWNSLENSTKAANSLTVFKKLIRNHISSAVISFRRV